MSWNLLGYLNKTVWNWETFVAFGKQNKCTVDQIDLQTFFPVSSLQRREKESICCWVNLASGYNKTRDVFIMAHSVIPIVIRCGIWIQTSPTVQRKKPLSNGNRNSFGLKKGRTFGQLCERFCIIASCEKCRVTGRIVLRDWRKEENIPGSQSCCLLIRGRRWIRIHIEMGVGFWEKESVKNSDAPQIVLNGT